VRNPEHITPMIDDQSIPARPDPRRLTVGAASLNLLTAILWGGTAVANRFAVDTVPPVAVGAVRFALAALFMLFWCGWGGAPLALRGGQWRPPLICGWLLFLQITTFNVGIERSNASHGTLLINTFIFWVVAIEHFVTREHRLSLRQVLGLLIAAAGVVLLVATRAAPSAAPAVSASGDVATLGGDLLLVASALLLGIKFVYTKRAVQSVAPGTLIFWHDVIGVVLFTVCSAAFEQVAVSRVDAATVYALLFLGVVVSGFCFAAQAWLLQRYSASQISVFSFATPVFGVVFAVLLRGDELSPWLFLSGLCVAAGIVLVSTGPPSIEQ
jgi:drug/metabolite transporter (DMT)-like permease